jgi:hypothetical protein
MSKAFHAVPRGSIRESHHGSVAEPVDGTAWNAEDEIYAKVRPMGAAGCPVRALIVGWFSFLHGEATRPV